MEPIAAWCFMRDALSRASRNTAMLTGLVLLPAAVVGAEADTSSVGVTYVCSGAPASGGHKKTRSARTKAAPSCDVAER